MNYAERIRALREDEDKTQDEITKYVDLIKNAKNYKNSPYVLSEDEMIDIYKKHFARKRGR